MLAVVVLLLVPKRVTGLANICMLLNYSRTAVGGASPPPTHGKVANGTPKIDATQVIFNAGTIS